MVVSSIVRDLGGLRRKTDGTVYFSDLKPFIRKFRHQSDLADKLWQEGGHAERTLAIAIINPAHVMEELIDSWVVDLDEWGLCDGFTAQIVRPTAFARTKPFEWADRPEEYVRRAAFSLIAQMAWQRNDFEDKLFIDFLPLVEKYATDDRLYVKKAVNWALRDIGKRNDRLKLYALETALRLQEHDHKTARWVGRHRIKEVTGG